MWIDIKKHNRPRILDVGCVEHLTNGERESSPKVSWRLSSEKPTSCTAIKKCKTNEPAAAIDVVFSPSWALGSPIQLEKPKIYVQKRHMCVEMERKKEKKKNIFFFGILSSARRRDLVTWISRSVQAICSCIYTYYWTFIDMTSLFQQCWI